jgi:RNA polymerase sigma-70 factor (ECF subfamily)
MLRKPGLLNTLPCVQRLKGMHGLANAPRTGPAAPTDEAVVRQHLLAVWRYLRMHGASPHEADDLAQEAFVIALQKGAARLDPAATATFLRRTARFLFLRLRRGSVAVELADAVDQLWARDCEADGGDGLVAALRRCIEALQDRARRAIERSYGLGADDPASRARVAVELGMTENGVKTLLQRSREQLRQCLRRKS